MTRTCEARSLYHRAAADARLAMRDHCLDEAGMRAALLAVKAGAHWAGWYEGETTEDAEISGAVRELLDRPDESPHKTPSFLASPSDKLSVLPPDAMNARQLARLFGLTDRGARKAIVRGFDRGLPGFYRHGCPGTLNAKPSRPLDAGHNALDIEAAAKRRLAEEYDAAQDKGEVRGPGDRHSNSRTETEKAGLSDLGLTGKDIHEARQLRDAEQADPGAVPNWGRMLGLW